LGSLLGIFLFIRSLNTGKAREALYSGITLALVVLLNFRVIIIPVSLGILQFMFWLQDKNRRPVMKRLILFMIPLIAVVPAYEAFLALLRVFHIANMPSYLSAWSVNPGEDRYFDMGSLLTIPYILLMMEGPFLFMLIIMGCVAARKNVFLRWIVLVLGLHLLVCLFSMEKSFRITSAILALFPVLAAVGYCDLYARWAAHRGLRIIPLVLLIATIGQGILGAAEQLTFRSAMPQAVGFVNHRFGDAPVLTTDVPLTRLYAASTHLEPLRNQDIQDLQRFATEGYGALILDPLKYIMSTASRNWNDLALAPLVNAVEDKCQPIMTFKHYSPRLLEFFLYEHVGPTLQQTRRRLQSLDAKAGYLTVYDLKDCAKIINAAPGEVGALSPDKP